MDISQEAIRGDDKAFTALYKQYQQEMFSFLLGRLRNREDALDLTSDVFIAAYTGISGFKGDCSFRTWLYAIAKHKLNDYYTKKGLEDQRFTTLTEEKENLPGKTKMSEDLESIIDLQAILQRLLPAEQEVLLLHNVNGLKFAEVSEILNISEGYARVYHQRALIKARSLAGK